MESIPLQVRAGWPRAERWRPDLYILTGDEIPFVQAGWRDGAGIRPDMQRRFRAGLAAGRVPWFEVSGTPGERLGAALSRIDALLAAGWLLADPLG